jgi:hypothetical protein
VKCESMYFVLVAAGIAARSRESDLENRKCGKVQKASNRWRTSQRVKDRQQTAADLKRRSGSVLSQ